MDHTVHLADILRWYLGSEVVEVYAQTNRIFHADEVTVETGGLLMLTFANGVFASHRLQLEQAGLLTRPGAA